VSDTRDSRTDHTVPPYEVLVEFWREQQNTTVPPYRLLLDFWEQARVGFHIVGGDGTILYANKMDLAYGHVGESIATIHCDPSTITDILTRLTAGEAISNYKARLRRFDGSVAIVSITSIGRFDAGALRGTRCVTCDVTEEQARADEKQQLLDKLQFQADAIKQMEVPIVEIWKDVLLVPIVGIVDSTRAAALMEQLLSHISSRATRFAILDLTGIAILDTATADHLLKTARAAALIGSQVVVTGLSPAVAQTIVALGVDLSGLMTLGTVDAALRHCLQRMRR
jgi:anti-anti-sigma regulatory factor